MKPFIHLHVHTEYSLLDGAARIKKLIDTVKSYDMPAVAITDHGNMYGVIAFYKECKAKGIKPIIGCEVYIADDLKVKAGKSKQSHLLLIAKNETGYKNLAKLNSIAYIDGFYYKPRIDYKVLEQYSEGIIALSGCLGADIPQAIMARQFDEAENLVLWFKRVFKDDFYIELQNHGLEEQIFVNEVLRDLAQKHNIKKVVTNDVHYIFKDDAEMQDVLMCVQMGKTLDDPNRLKFPANEFYLKTYDQLAELFPNDLDALDNTVEIADKCNIEFSFGHYLFPKYLPPDNKTPEEFMLELVEKGLNKKYKVVTQEMRDRVDLEMQVIKGQGFIEYFLTVWDYIDAAKRMDISVGPGRGSGAGSLVAYAMDITNVNPLKYELLFERFLHNERVTAPDFDIDFADDRRGEVIDYVKSKYGEDKVVKIITFGTMAAKAAIKDVARVLRMPYSEVDKITKAIPNSVKKPQVIKKCFGLYTPKEGDKDYGVQYGVPELIELYNNSIEVKKVIDIAIKLEDMPRQASTHACGVVIGADKLIDHIPLARNGEDITTQYNMIELEELGHLKMDFLGLRNLSDIQKTLDLVKQNHDIDIDFDQMDYDDAEVYKLISTGNTKAIFQIESTGFQKFMRELKPTSIEDITAGVSLYRPGPMDSIPRYVHNKHNPKDVVYDHPILEPILNVTYGCIVYQEQVMRIVQDMAGYSLGQADMVRRMMGKKKLDAMMKEKEVFLNGKPEKDGKPAIDGAIKRGVKKEVAEKIWSEMESFASYAFNKSHAAAYSLITYQTAYLKCYYEPEFLTAVLNNRITNADEIKNYVTYAREEKIEVLPPSINKSQTMFSVKDGKIRFGLAALKGVGVNVIDQIIANRDQFGDFTSIVDFINRFDTTVLNKRTLESLIYSGAFDEFGVYRSQLIRVYPTLIERSVLDRKNKASGQFSLFEDVLKEDLVNDVSYPNIPEYDEQTKLKLEKEVVGVYISGHPLSKYVDMYSAFSLTSDMISGDDEDEIFDIVEDDQTQEKEYNVKDGMEVTCGGIIVEIKKLLTKRDNKEMAFVKLEDLYGYLELMFFPQSYAKFKTSLAVDKLVTIKGKINIRVGENPIVLVDTLEPWDLESNNAVQEKETIKTLYLKYDTTNASLHKEVSKILSAYKGESPVVVKCQVGNNSYKLDFKVNVNSFIINELNAYIQDENIIIK